MVAGTHISYFQELSLNGVLLHTQKEERAELLLCILEITRDQGLIALDVSGNRLRVEEWSLVASFLQGIK